MIVEETYEGAGGEFEHGAHGAAPNGARHWQEEITGKPWARLEDGEVILDRKG